MACTAGDGVRQLRRGEGMQGPDAVKFLEGLVVGDIAGIPNGSGSLSVFTNEKGGIIDDTVITKVCPLISSFILQGMNLYSLIEKETLNQDCHQGLSPHNNNKPVSSPRLAPS
jgi:Aminomethyltransferase folate-binding domain